VPGRSLVTIYCDGACSPNPGIGGWAAILISAAPQKRLEIYGSEPRSTNNRMELTAALMGLKELKRPCDVAVHTDSQYLHNAFTAGWIDKWLKNGWKTSDRKPVQNEDLWRELLAQTQVHAVAWRWVRGHAGDVENGRADELAVAAREALASRLRGG